jgi:lysophospholipase L1-like esterase
MASGHDSHAEGNNTIASGSYSHAEGEGSNDYYIIKLEAYSPKWDHLLSLSNGMPAHFIYESLECKTIPQAGDKICYLDENSKIQRVTIEAIETDTWEKIIDDGFGNEELITCRTPNVLIIAPIGYGEEGTDIEGELIYPDLDKLNDKVCYKGENPIGAIGTSSHVEGEKTAATNIRAHAEGYLTVASGDTSHAEGSKTNATNTCAHSEGYTTTASGIASHAEGYNTTASGRSSHAEGESNLASGNYAHAEGFETVASGSRAHAEGHRTIAAGYWQHVEGGYNIEDTTDDNGKGKYVHIVGNGKDSNNRANAHTLDWSGNAWFSGNVYVGNTNQNDGMKLATESYVNDKIEKISIGEFGVDLSTLVPQKVLANLIQEENIVYGKLYQRASNTWTTNANYDTVKIPCKANETFYACYDGDATTSKLTLVYMDANENWVNDDAVRPDKNVSTKTFFTVPDIDSIAYMYYIIKHPYKEKAAVYRTNEVPKFFVPQGKSVILKDKATPWNGKKWYAYGTSITDVAVGTGKYAPYLAELAGMSLVNKGIGSQGIANAELGGYEGSTGGVMTALMSDDGKAEADLITIEVGANDTGVVAAGNMGDYFDTDDTTFCGRLNQCLQYLQANTNAQILVIGSPYAATEAVEWKNKYQLYKATEECCRYNGIQYLYPSDNVGTAKLNATAGKYLAQDHTTIHQSELGGYIYASHIWEKIKTLPLFI